MAARGTGPQKPYEEGASDPLRRYQASGSLAELEQAIAAYEQTVNATSPGSPDGLAALNGLGVALRYHYNATKNLANLTRAIKIFKKVVDQLPPGPDQARVLGNRAAALRDRYDATHHLSDLTRAIELFEAAVAQAGGDLTTKLPSLNNLGMALRARFERRGDPADIQQAVEVLDALVAQTPKGAPQWPDRLDNLGLALQARFANTGAQRDIDRAIRAHRQAVAEAGHDGPGRLRYLNNLGNGMSLRYDASRDQGDLAKAIAILEDVVAQTPEDAPQRPGRFENLATAKARFEQAAAGRGQETRTASYQCPRCGRQTTTYVDDKKWPIGRERRGRPLFVGVLMMLVAGVAAASAAWVLLLVGQTIANALLVPILSWEPSDLRNLLVAIVLLPLKVFLPVYLIRRIGHVIFRVADVGKSGNPAIGAIAGLLAGLLLLLGLIGIDYFDAPSFGTVLGDLAGLGGLVGLLFGLLFGAQVLMFIVGLSALTIPPMYAFRSIKHTPFCGACRRYMRVTTMSPASSDST